MPCRTSPPERDDGRLTQSSNTAAGTGNPINPPKEGGHEVRERREPARTHQEGGNGNALRRQQSMQATGATTSRGRNHGRGAPTSEARDTGQGSQAGSATRPRNEPNGRLDQPRRKRGQLKIALINVNRRGNHSQDKWGSISSVLKRRKIAVLALQEMHPNDELQETMEKRFRNSLHC